MQKACAGGGQKLLEVLNDRLAQERVDALDKTLVEVRFFTLN